MGVSAAIVAVGALVVEKRAAQTRAEKAMEEQRQANQRQIDAITQQRDQERTQEAQAAKVAGIKAQRGYTQSTSLPTGRQATILTSPLGQTDSPQKAGKTLLGV